MISDEGLAGYTGPGDAESVVAVAGCAGPGDAESDVAVLVVGKSEHGSSSGLAGGDAERPLFFQWT